MAEKKFVFSADADRADVAEKALTDTKILKLVVDSLAGDDRRSRQAAASVVRIVSETNASLLKPYAPELTDALHRPESQTRWEVLSTFEKLVDVDARLVDKALAGAETALHDEESGVVRLAAFRLLCTYGATTSHRSDRVWPLIDDAIRCYHGDDEFPAMLTSIIILVTGGASDAVKTAAAERMLFDSENGKGLLKRRATSIVKAAPKKRGRKKPAEKPAE
ncbi:MAG: hypothetical protein HGB10_05840 [Coriobacteriia bacterium]|nr:hypothetical protein [Coriobacteriia bacterium]